jgi:hypothetical protein
VVTDGNPGLGISNTLATTANWAGETNNSVGFSGHAGVSSVYRGGVQVDSILGYATGDWLGIAVGRAAQIIQFRNITQSSASSSGTSISVLGLGPVALMASGYDLTDQITANFDGGFLGSPPAAGYARRNGAPV